MIYSKAGKKLVKLEIQNFYHTLWLFGDGVRTHSQNNYWL